MKIQEKDPNRLSEVPETLPLLPLRDLVVFPHMVVPLFVGRERSVAALEAAMASDRLILLVAQKDATTNEPSEEDIYRVGTLAEILQLLKLPDGTIKVLVEGIARFFIQEYIPNIEYFEVRASDYTLDTPPSNEIEALMRNAVRHFEEYVKLNRRIPPETVMSVGNYEDPAKVGDIIAAHMIVKVKDKQELLELRDLKERLDVLSQKLLGEIEILKIEQKIRSEVRGQMEMTQREYYLNEQLKAIQKELGKRDDETAEVDEIKEKIEKAGMPEVVKAKADKELKRLEKMSPMSAESSVVRTYLDWLVELPWSNAKEEKLDIKEAEKVLDEDHYGLEKPKERIIEYLAVRKLSQELKGPILCFVGPPGTGKTSLGRSIARALGRDFVRISLGGVRDEAEIRGHRRTYVGALPGRIIQGMKRAGTTNPVFLLDEVDKMSMDFRGDPSAALLEVLDPEQNKNFQDHYLDLDYDLSQVMFITTANILHPIPRPLQDRMEIINLSGYTDYEKEKIADLFLIPKQMEEHGLTEEMISFAGGAVMKIIQDYTREAGVRNLERSIARCCRKAAREIVEKGEGHKVRITKARLVSFLGKPKYRRTEAEKEPEEGIATGLAWTEVGGEVLSVEAITMPGKGNLTLTGKLGEVMQESARAALGYIRSRSGELGIEKDFLKKRDIHIHVPEGAIPKDGPSAGITMATALASILSKRPSRSDVAMTGEITLRGKVLPIGGLKEKALAAHRAGISTIIIPKENERDLDDIPPAIRKKVDFHLVESMEEVLPIALLDKKKGRGKAPARRKRERT